MPKACTCRLQESRLVLDNSIELVGRVTMSIQKILLSFIVVSNAHAMNELHAQLIASVQTQKEEQICALLDKGADPNICENGMNALHAAAKIGRTAIVRMLVERGAKVDAIAPAYLDGTALCLAVYHGYADTVEELLKLKANPNHRLRDIKITPLHIAAMKGKENIAALLLDAEADANAKNKDNCTPLHAVAEAGKYEIVQFMQKRIEPQKPMRKPEILVIAQNNLVETARILLKHGASLNHAPIKGTPLHVAARNGHKDLVQFFIEQGADICSLRPILATPLHEMVVGLAIEIARNPKDISCALPLLHAFIATPSKEVINQAKRAVFSFACSLAFLPQRTEVKRSLPKDVQKLLYRYGIINFVADFQLKLLQKALSLKMKFAGYEFTPAQLAAAQSSNGNMPALKQLEALLNPTRVEQHRKLITTRLLNKIEL